MLRKICGFHQDDAGDWVAELDCHHGQHVRHKPPFFNRPWVETPDGRMSQLGAELNCVRCDQLEFPQGLGSYKRTPEFTEATVPKGLLKQHSTKAGTWALIHVEEGTLLYTVNEPAERSMALHAGSTGVISPLMLHSVAPQGKVRFYVEFFMKDGVAPSSPHTSDVLGGGSGDG